MNKRRRRRKNERDVIDQEFLNEKGLNDGRSKNSP
jgi:hypothetical protein